MGDRRHRVDFGHNRQESLELAYAFSARSLNSYGGWIDADDQFTSIPAERPDLTLDGYYVTNHFGATSFSGLRLTRLARPWRWTGTQFYLAQSWRDAGEQERALTAYRTPSDNEVGWDQERWYARFRRVHRAVGDVDMPPGRPRSPVTRRARSPDQRSSRNSGISRSVFSW